MDKVKIYIKPLEQATVINAELVEIKYHDYTVTFEDGHVMVRNGDWNGFKNKDAMIKFNSICGEGG